MGKVGSNFQDFLEDAGIADEVNEAAEEKVKEGKVVHWLPPYRRDTYCGLNPGKERAKGKPIQTTDMRPRLSCPDCKGLPVDESVS